MERIDTTVSRVGVDLLTIAVLVLVSPVIGMYLDGSVLRFIFVFLLLFVTPGYLAMVALLPEDPPTDEQSTVFGLSSTGIGPTERLALTVGLSVALIPFFAFGLWIVGVGADGYDFAYFAVFVLGLVALAIIRRGQTPADRRYLPKPARALQRGWTAVRRWPVLNQFMVLIVALAVVAAFTMLTVAIASPQDGEQFTEFLVGTVNEDDEFVLGGYPDSLDTGSSTDYTVKVINHEGTDQSYEVIAELQATDNGRLVASEELERATIELADGEEIIEDMTVDPSMTGSDLKLVFTLIPEHAEDGEEQQTVYLWIEVTDE